MIFSYFVLYFRFKLYVLDGGFATGFSRPTGWTHVVMNYIGPDDGQGIRGYYNGAEVASETTKYGGSYPAGDGRIVVGRFYIDHDKRYTSLKIDELIFFNKALSTTDTKLLYNACLEINDCSKWEQWVKTSPDS